MQHMGWALTALGLSESGLLLLSDRYTQAIAAPTRRKLALLVGINSYPEQVCDYVPARGAALNGCVTDVALQQELLIHRFGFQPSDIVTLTDQQATRQAIETAFQEHLMQQARSGDVVVFHFSGLGSQVKLEDSTQQNSLVPVNGLLPTADNPALQDVMEATLAGLLRSLRTDQVLAVVDAGYSALGQTFQGNLRIRSRPNAPSGRIEPAELALQEQLSREIGAFGGVSEEKLLGQWRSEQWPGAVLSASRANQIATEVQWNGFSAGLFTYALTQQLWWATPATTLHFSFSQATDTVRQIAGLEQQPALSGKPPASLLDAESVSAEGVVQSVEGEEKIHLWLGGLPASVLENCGASIFSLQPSAWSDEPQSNPPLLELRSREGLTAQARRLSSTAPEPPEPILPGQWVQERVRILPRNVGLTVAIDASLERIERVDATSAFAAIPRVSSVIAGEQPADFLFGKPLPALTLTASLPSQILAGATPKAQTDSPSPLPAKANYGLFYAGRDPIPSTLTQTDEAVKTAVNRMTPQLQTLLATKLLHLTENCGSSRLGVRVTMQSGDVFWPQETTRFSGGSPKTAATHQIEKLTIPLGSRIQYQLENCSDRPLYFLVLGLDTAGNAIAFYPTAAAAPLEETVQASLIPASETLVLSPADWVAQAIGLAQTDLVFSRSPLMLAYQALGLAMRAKSDARRVMLLPNSLEVVQALWQDLHQASAAILPKVEVPADAYAMDVNAWATLRFVYQVVEA